MTIYYITISFCLFYGYMYQHVESKVKVIMNLSFVLGFILIFGFRFEVGVDWFNYIEVYKRHISSKSFFDTTEIGYKLINFIAYYINKEIVVSILISTILFITFTLYGISRLNLNPYYFFVLIAPYHFVMSGMNFTRQSIALSIIIMAFGFLLQKNKMQFLILVFLSGLFHTSAWCFFPLVFIKSKFRYVFITILIVVPLLIFQMLTNYNQYISSNIDSAGLFLRLIYLLPCAFFAFINYSKFKYDLVTKRLTLLVILSVPLILVISLLSTTIADRFAYYFIVVDTLIIYYQFNQIGGWDKRYLNRYGPITLFITSITAMITWHMYSQYIESYIFDSYLLHWYWY